jgi:hypothetical protein
LEGLEHMMADAVRVRGSLTHATLRLMQGVIDAWGVNPWTVNLARQICRNAGATDRISEAHAIWDWVQTHVQYRLDPVGAEWVQDPFETIEKQGAGDCDDMAVAVGALLQAIGHPATACAVWWAGRDEYTHAATKDEALGIVVDPCSPLFQPWPRPGMVLHAVMGAK